MAKNSSYDSPIWKIIDVGGNAIAMNLMFLICCIPIVTIGPAVCALFSAVRYYIRGESIFKGFFNGFKTNFFRVALIWVICLAAVLYLFNDVYLFIADFSKALIPYLAVSVLLLLLVLMFAFTVLIFNVYFPDKFMPLLNGSAKFMFSNFPQVFICAVFMWAPFMLLLGGELLWGIIYEFVIVFIAFYFAVIAIAATILLKNPLIKVLNEKRNSGEIENTVNYDE